MHPAPRSSPSSLIGLGGCPVRTRPPFSAASLTLRWSRRSVGAGCAAPADCYPRASVSSARVAKAREALPQPATGSRSARCTCRCGCPDGAHARYVDRYSREDLRREYPELRTHDLVEVDVVDDGETLATVADASADFVIANHFIEHTEDPIRTLAQPCARHPARRRAVHGRPRQALHVRHRAAGHAARAHHRGPREGPQHVPPPALRGVGAPRGRGRRARSRRARRGAR